MPQAPTPAKQPAKAGTKLGVKVAVTPAAKQGPAGKKQEASNDEDKEDGQDEPLVEVKEPVIPVDPELLKLLELHNQRKTIRTNNSLFVSWPRERTDEITELCDKIKYVKGGTKGKKRLANWLIETCVSNLHALSLSFVAQF